MWPATAALPTTPRGQGPPGRAWPGRQLRQVGAVEVSLDDGATAEIATTPGSSGEARRQDASQGVVAPQGRILSVSDDPYLDARGQAYAASSNPGEEVPRATRGDAGATVPDPAAAAPWNDVPGEHRAGAAPHNRCAWPILQALHHDHKRTGRSRASTSMSLLLMPGPPRCVGAARAAPQWCDGLRTTRRASGPTPAASRTPGRSGRATPRSRARKRGAHAAVVEGPPVPANAEVGR